MVWIAIGALLFIGLVKLIQVLANRGVKSIERWESEQEIKNNPYVNYHNLKLNNDSLHKKYLDWMDKKNVPGVPVSKAKFSEEDAADKKIKGLMS